MRRLTAGLALVGGALFVLSFALPTGGRGHATVIASPTLGSSVGGVALGRADAALGRALFQAKGCATCHVHRGTSARESLGVGPDLSDYRPNPEFVRAWLRDPAALRPGTNMPRLSLAPDEIEALIAFLQAGGRP